jgi:aminoglycoside phosphotransferase (APT) family kinase protein
MSGDPTPPPPPATLRWVLKQARADELVSVERLLGGWTSAIHGVVVRTGGAERSLVLRRMFRQPWKSHAAGLLGREAAILKLLEATAVPAPALVALDALAETTDEPALLMSRLPGRLSLRVGEQSDLLDELARMLATIHRITPGESDRPRPYQSWAVPERRVLPAWAQDPRVWERAFALIDADPPPYRGCFLHRDFHPGNVLFDGIQVTGVVDWVETSWGPADLDVAHCCTALALLHGPTACESLRATYRAAGGRLTTNPAERAYWELLDAVGYLPDPEKVARPWRESARPDLRAELARERLEAYVADILARAA